jgi:hypothetical protein
METLARLRALAHDKARLLIRRFGAFVQRILLGAAAFGLANPAALQE